MLCLVVSNLAILTAHFATVFSKKVDEKLPVIIKFWITHIYNLMTWGFLIYMLAVFPKIASKENNRSWLEYRKAFFLQVFGLF